MIDGKGGIQQVTNIHSRLPFCQVKIRHEIKGRGEALVKEATGIGKEGLSGKLEHR